MKMFENSGFEKQLVANSLSVFSLSLAALSTPWKTCIHYLSVDPLKTTAASCGSAICFASAAPYWGERCRIGSAISTSSEMPFNAVTLGLLPNV